MAKPSLILTKLSVADRERLEADIIGSELSWRQLGKKYGLPHQRIVDYAERNGLIRNPSGLKRALVQQAMARAEPDTNAAGQPTGQPTGQRPVPAGRAEIEAAAAIDVKDMNLACAAARAGLSLAAMKLQHAAQLAQVEKRVDMEAREIKILAECVSINTDILRRVRGLEVGIGLGDLKNMSDAQLQDLIEGRAPRP